MTKRAKQTHKVTITYGPGIVQVMTASSLELAQKAARAKQAYAKRWGDKIEVEVSAID